MKAHAPDLRAIEKLLRSMGGKKVADLVEVDTYFSHPGRDFARTDEALRVRVCGGRSTMTYKGPKLDARSKSREEINVELADGKATRTLLERLGFTKVAEVRKRRRLYKLGMFELCLDRVEAVGEFVEVEIRTPKSRYRKCLAAAIALLEKLKLGKTERRSYLELLLSRGRMRPIKGT